MLILHGLKIFSRKGSIHYKQPNFKPHNSLVDVFISHLFFVLGKKLCNEIHPQINKYTLEMSDTNYKYMYYYKMCSTHVAHQIFTTDKNNVHENLYICVIIKYMACDIIKYFKNKLNIFYDLWNLSYSVVTGLPRSHKKNRTFSGKKL